MTTVCFTNNHADVTEGEYRDDLGRLSSAESEYVQTSTGMASESPRHAKADTFHELPTMREIYSTKFLRDTIVRPDISLETIVEAPTWSFQDVRTRGGNCDE